MKLQTLTAAQAKELGFATKVEAIKYIEKNIVDYKGKTTETVLNEIRTLIRTRNMEIEQAEAKRVLTAEMLATMHVPKEKIVQQVENNKNKLFRPCYVQVRIEAVTALTWCLYNDLDSEYVVAHFADIVRIFRDYVNDNIDDLDGAIVALTGSKNITAASSFVNYNTGLDEPPGDAEPVMTLTKDEAIKRNAPMYYEDPNTDGITENMPGVNKRADKLWKRAAIKHKNPVHDPNAPANLDDAVKNLEHVINQPEVVPYQRGDLVRCIFPRSSREERNAKLSAASDVYLYLAEMRVINTIVFTEREYTHFISRMRAALMCAFNQVWFDEKSTLPRKDNNINRQRYQSLIDSVDIIERFYISDDTELRYVIQGFYHELGRHIMEKFAEEAPIVQMPNKNPGTCLINCIVDQCKDHIGVMRMRVLEKYNEHPITIATVDKIAQDCQLHIQLYDFELYKWRDVDYSVKNNAHRVSRAVIVLKNNHAHSMKKKYRKAIKDITNVHRKKHFRTHMMPLEHQCEDMHIGTVGLAMHPTRLVFDQCVSSPCECGDQHPRSKTITEIESGIYFFAGNIDTDIIGLLTENGISPAIVANRNNIHALNLTVTDTMPDGSTRKRIISLRSQRTRHEYLMFTPHTHNYTINSVSGYLFRTFIKEPLMYITDATISRIFKSKCSPIVRVEAHTSENKYCYIIDMVKAYRSCTALDEIGVFTEYPTIHKYEEGVEYKHMGIYYCSNGEWLFHDELAYRKGECGEDLQPTMYIYFNKKTPVFSEYANAVANGGLCIDIRPEDAKIMYNSLVGSFHPCMSERAVTMILKGGDLDRFLLNPNHIIHTIDRLANGDNLIRFNYSDTGVVENLSHISAQIISRCRLQVRKVSDALQRVYGAKIVGTMTDSIIFVTDKSVDFARVGVTVGNDLGQWTVKQGTHLTAWGPGRYTLRNYTADGEFEAIITRTQGYSHEDRTTQAIMELFARKTDYVGKRAKNTTIVPNIPDPITHSLFIGEAGVGKSRYITENYSSRDCMVVCPTGLSAASVKGRTIFGAFGLGHDGTNTIADCMIALKKDKRTRIATAQYIIVDECYMVGEETMHKVNEICKIIMGNQMAFGGKTLIMFGDDRQLPSTHETPFMGSELYQSLQIDEDELKYKADGSCRLTEDWRDICNFAREERTQKQLVDYIGYLRTLCAKEPIVGATQVYYANHDVNAANTKALAEVAGKIYIVGDERYKVGCPIMLTRNGKIRDGIYNGNIGTFMGYDDDHLNVRLRWRGKDGVMETADKSVPNYTHITLAYAITIHKIQGQTLDSICIRFRKHQLSSPDATRLLYVALTRVASADKCYIEII